MYTAVNVSISPVLLVDLDQVEKDTQRGDQARVVGNRVTGSCGIGRYILYF